MVQSSPPLIACLNSSQDLVELLGDVLEYGGFRTASLATTHREGAQPAIDFLRRVRPQACVYAVSVPYRESWAVYQEVQQAIAGCAWVLTTTNKRALTDLVGQTAAFEIMGKPYDIDQLVAVVRHALDMPVDEPGRN